MLTARPLPRRPRRLPLAAATSLLLCVVALVLPSPARADDEAWRTRLEASLATVEAGVAELDAQKAAPGKLLARIQALHARLIPLEAAAKLVPGTIRGKEDLGNATQDVATLTTRWKKVVEVRKGPTPPPPPLPPPSHSTSGTPVPEAPKKPQGKPWPEMVQFKVNAKIVYAQTGQWQSIEIEPYIFQSQFLADGYRGNVSFTLRAANLVRDVKSAVIRVAIRLRGPLTQRAQEYRIYDVTWTADRAFGDDSYRSFPNVDDISLPMPPRWVVSPDKGTSSFDAEAYVVSAVLPSGERLTFQTPTWETR